MISRTPLRYPGGKGRLAPFVNEILVENKIQNAHYVEPYAGGAGAAFQLLFSKQVSSIHLNDSSRAIYAFWYSVLNRTTELCNMIISATLTVEEWRQRQRIVNNPSKHTLLELGFSTLYLNRCNRSGILSGGVIGGLDQQGNYKMDARFSRTDLVNKIQAIASKKSSITLTNLDAEEFLTGYDKIFPQNTLIYLDPPYYEKGSKLYQDFYNDEDHRRLSKHVQKKLKTRWILSYDAAGAVLDLYENRRRFIYELQYNASSVYKGKEVFIFCDRILIPTHSSISYIEHSLAG